MTKPRVFEKPLGVRDLLPETVPYKKMLEDVFQKSMTCWGYEEIMTPTLEYYDTVGVASAIAEDKLFKLLDRSGRTLVLRPDMTAPIARVIASLLQDQPLPVRYSYHGSVFRAQEQEAGRHAEFFQSGIELVGDPSADADAEVIALAVECLQQSKVKDFQFVIGSMAFVDRFLHEMAGSADHVQHLKKYLLLRDYVGFRKFVDGLDVTQPQRNGLKALLSLRGNFSKLADACTLTQCDDVRAALDNMAHIWEALEGYGMTDSIQLDLTLVSTLNYYTGMIFEGYATGLGFPVCSGGRYDGLLTQFEREMAATGFALKLDRIMEVSRLKLPAPLRKISVQYDTNHRREALAYVRELRGRGDCTVITRPLADQYEWQKDTADNEKFDEIITFGGEAQ